MPCSAACRASAAMAPSSVSRSPTPAAGAEGAENSAISLPGSSATTKLVRPPSSNPASSPCSAFPSRRLPRACRLLRRPLDGYASNCALPMPCSSYSRRIASSIKLFGQLAPAVIPIVTGRRGSQFSVVISVFCVRDRNA